MATMAETPLPSESMQGINQPNQPDELHSNPPKTMLTKRSNSGGPTTEVNESTSSVNMNSGKTLTMVETPTLPALPQGIEFPNQLIEPPLNPPKTAPTERTASTGLTAKVNGSSIHIRDTAATLTVVEAGDDSLDNTSMEACDITELSWLLPTMKSDEKSVDSRTDWSTGLIDWSEAEFTTHTPSPGSPAHSRPQTSHASSPRSVSDTTVFDQRLPTKPLCYRIEGPRREHALKKYHKMRLHRHLPALEGIAEYPPLLPLTPKQIQLELLKRKNLCLRLQEEFLQRLLVKQDREISSL